MALERADVDELQACLQRAKQPRVIAHLQQLLDEWRAELLEHAEPQQGNADAPRPAAQAPPPAPVKLEGVPLPSAPALEFQPITSFSWDQGSYGSEWVNVYITSGVDGVTSDMVQCKFDKASFDLQVRGLDGKNLRLLKDNLDKDIVPAESKAVVKKNRIVVKLRKVRGEFGPDHWVDLTSKRPRAEKEAASTDPASSIMDMMKQLYEDGDDDMRKTIGEAMEKSRRENLMGLAGGGGGDEDW